MRGTLRCRLSASRALHSHNDDAFTRALLHRWFKLRAAPPASATAATTALLEETVHQLSMAHPLPIAGASPATATPPARTLSHSLLQPKQSGLIWSALQRQGVPWEKALTLLPWQLEVMSPAQRRYVQRRVGSTPWDVSQIVRMAEDAIDDPALVRQFRAMKQATYTVEYARLVSAALRERPSLPGGLLPVPYGVLVHGYELGRRSAQDAEVVLAVSKHLALLGRSALSRTAEERLVLGHAALEGVLGNWAAALAVVTASRAVRLSVRRGYERFTQALGRSSADQPEPRQSATERLASAQTPTGAVAAKQMVPFLQAEGGDGEGWRRALQAFLALPAEQQTYAEARQLLAALPAACAQHSDSVCLAATVLRHAARRMYAGTLTRRLLSSARTADWCYALSLATAARCYDLAAPLLPIVQLLPGSKTTPPELDEYVRTVREVAAAGVEAAAASDDSPQSHRQRSSLLPTAAAAAALSYPQALAHALEGGPAARAVLLAASPHAQSVPRLRSLLLASRAAEASPNLVDGEAESDGDAEAPDCHTYQSAALSQLVCAAASVKQQRYFWKVLPASLRRHHFRVSPLTSTPLVAAAEAAVPADEDRLMREDATDNGSHASSRSAPDARGSADTVAVLRDRVFHWQSRTVRDAQGCTELLADLSEYLRAAYTVEGAPASPRSHGRPRLTEDAFLRAIAAIGAWGTVQLPAADRFRWPLAVLQAAWLLRVPIDASLVAAAVRAVPSMFVDAAALALPSALNALTLLGEWRAALQMCHRLRRKEQDGAVRLESGDEGRRTHTLKYVPPPPTVREAMAQVGYAAPAACALEHWAALDASAAAVSLPLLLTELRQHRDSRQLCEEVRRITASSRLAHRSCNRALSELSRRRMLLGAAFAILDDESALQRVVRAGGRGRVRAEDLDCHGLQRLLAVLPPSTVARVLVAEAAEGRCAQTHWRVACAARPELTLAEVRALASVRPCSPLLSAVCCFRVAAEDGNAVLCLAALVRLAELAVEHPAQRVAVQCVVRLLRAFLSHECLLLTCVQHATPPPAASLEGSLPLAGSRASDTLRLSRRLFNRLQEIPLLSGAMRQARRHVRPFMQAQTAGADDATMASRCAVWVVLMSQCVAASRATQVPVPAAFTAELLRRCVAVDSADWVAALFFFNALHRPTVAERVVLVHALRHCGGAATPLLVQHRRFMRHHPEQLVLWADEAGGPTKWERSVALLAGEADAGVDVQPPVPSPVVRDIVDKWNADECLRAVQLLRRQGFVRVAEKQQRTLDGVSVEESDPHARRQVHAIVALLRQRMATCASGAASSEGAVKDKDGK